MGEIEAKRELTRSEVAEYLHEFAAQLDTSREATGADAAVADTASTDAAGTSETDTSAVEASEAGSGSRPRHRAEESDGRVTFMVGNDSATINPPETVGFEVGVDSDTSFVGNRTEHEVEFELTWETEARGDDEGEEDLEIR